MSRSVSLFHITGSRTGEREKAPPAQGDRGVAVTVLSPPHHRLQKSRRDRGGGSTSPLIQLFVKCLPLSRNRIRKVKFKVTSLCRGKKKKKKKRLDTFLSHALTQRLARTQRRQLIQSHLFQQ